MTPRRLRPALLALVLLPFAALAHAADPAPAHAPFPEDFLQWKQVKAPDFTKVPAGQKPTQAGFVYANPAALEGLRTGSYPEGAVLVFDIFKVVTQPDGSLACGERASTSTMVRDARFAETGGWQFEDYDIASHAALEMNAAQACYACHTKVAPRQFVFTRLKS
ncbi:MAG: cytochrome P460 family protein [Candidatus Didemnitutus sp.]|nr:cytochrome P460 family protein [Candidatus Didemnitutus sp.]